MNIKGFNWDARNIGHIAKHDVTPEEVEEVFAYKPKIRKGRGKRYYAKGQTFAGRYLFVVFEILKYNRCRPISAREMTASERRAFRRK